jgi:ring-1,2-phenylacetyl-CoA epoxidase subunit PaaE
MKYFHLKVKEVIRETADAITISFWHPLNEMIKYEPGQFLTLILTINGHKVRRSYSMSSSPQTDASPAITVKRVPGGLVSNWLNDYTKEGDFIEVAEPMGSFKTTADTRNSRSVVLIGAGSGITPLMAIAKSILKVENESRVVVLYGNRDENSVIFEKQLAAMCGQYGTRLQVEHSLSQPAISWAGHRGRLNKTQIIRLLENIKDIAATSAEYFVCGPTGMMDEAQRALDILGVSTSQIHKESFVTTASVGDVATKEEADGSLKTREITVIYEGSEYKFDVAPHQNILEAALDLDIDLPYSCQAGMCTACMGKCTSGSIKLDEEDGLTAAELKAGFILTCVAHPLSDGVIIEIE